MLIKVIDICKVNIEHLDFVCTKVAWEAASKPGVRYGLFSVTIAFAFAAKMVMFPPRAYTVHTHGLLQVPD